jgi:hypothetical protein
LVGSIRAVVTTTRVFVVGVVLAVVAVACSSPTNPPADFGDGPRFLAAVADSQDQVGIAPSIAIGEDGTAYVASFGFPDEVEEGEIPASRPIGSPFLPAVLLTAVSPEGMFTRGAVAQTVPEAEPAGIEPPFRPAKFEDLGLTPQTVNGTDVAVGPTGVHVVWTAGNMVSHAVSVTGEDSVATTVFELDLPVDQAGPLGRPSVALDGTGTPWVAFGVNDGDQVSILVATPDGDTWAVQEAASAGRCNGCPPPLPTAIVAPGDVPIVAYGDPVDGSVHAATLDGETWTDQVVGSGADGSGMAGTTSGEDAMLTYYSGAGEVRLATWSGGAWTTASAAETSDPSEVTGGEAAMTGVAVAEDGTVWVTWQDGEGVQLATGDGSSFTPVDTVNTAGGISPSIGVSPEGTVAIAWYDPSVQNLMLGFYGDPEEVAIARPSPQPTISLAPVAPVGCGDDGELVLDVAAADATAFNTNCLVGPANEPFQINFQNDNAGVLHNVTVLPEAGAAEPIVREAPFPGVAEFTYEVPALDAGDYYFQCDVHLNMNGTLAVIESQRK